MTRQPKFALIFAPETLDHLDAIAVAVLLTPLDDDDLERLVLARSPRFQALLDQSRQSIKAGKGLSRAEFWETARQRSRQQAGQKVVSAEAAG